MMGLKCLLCVPLLLQASAIVDGHGNMVRPMAWWDANQSGWYWDAGVADNGVGCGVLDLPDSEFVGGDWQSARLHEILVHERD